VPFLRRQAARRDSILPGLVFLFWVVFLHAPRVAGSLRNGDESASMVVALAMSASAFIFAAWADSSGMSSTKG
jgi:hypothetical protein